MVQAWPMLEIQLFSYKNCDFFEKPKFGTFPDFRLFKKP